MSLFVNSWYFVSIEFSEGHPLCLLVKSVAEERRIISVSVDKEEVDGVLVSCLEVVHK